MTKRVALVLAGIVASSGGVLADTPPAAAAAPPLVNAECVGQGAMLAVFESGAHHDDDYACTSTQGAVILDLSRSFQGAMVTAGSEGQTSTQTFR
jgi:hypothetical protein